MDTEYEWERGEVAGEKWEEPGLEEVAETANLLLTRKFVTK